MKTLLLPLILLCATAQASEQIETPNFSEVAQKIREVGAKFGNQNVLVVFDTDDTLLVLNHAIGSEAWFEWQTNDEQCENSCTPAMKTPVGDQAVAKSFGELLTDNGEILYLSHTHPNEAEIPADLKSLQTDGFQTVVLTSRGFLNRDATQNQYAENGIAFTSVGLTANQVGIEYVPALTDLEKQKYGITSVRPVNYTRGIINTDGQHKGVMLAAWMREVHYQPAAIVFVDNESRQTNRVFSVFNGGEIDITTIRYSHADADRDAFWSGDKAQAIQEWQDFSKLSGKF